MIQTIDEREDPSDKAIACDLDHLAKAIAIVLADQDVPTNMHVTLTAIDATVMHELNLEHMDHDYATDVLSFPLDSVEDAQANPEVEYILGDILVAPKVAQAQAQEAGHSTQAELELLTVHGALHLLGYDHAEPADHAQMFGLTWQLLARLRGHDEDNPPTQIVADSPVHPPSQRSPHV